MKNNPNHWLRLLLGLLSALASATLLTLAFPPYNIGQLIWVGFIPMLVAQYVLVPSRFSSLASALTVGGWLGVMLVPMFGGKSFFMAIIPLLAGLLGFFMDWNKRAFHERTGYRWFVFEGAVGWVGLEMLRSQIPALGTWLFAGYPLWNQPWLIQPLSLVGIFGLDLLIMLSNYTLAQGLILLLKARWTWDDTPRPNPRSTYRWLVAFGVLLITWTGISLTLYARPSSPTPRIVRVAAIQPHLPRAAHLDVITPPEQRLALLVAQTRQAAVLGAQLIVWPEMSINFDPQVEHTQELQSLAADTQAYIVIAYVLDDAHGFRNEATVLAPSGDFLGFYGKTHPAVFSGEPKTTRRGMFPVYQTSVGNLATMICFDAGFTDVSRQYARQGAGLIAVPSLFGPSIAAQPHTQVVFRAIENRLAIVMPDVAYNSALVDPHGRILERSFTPQGSQAILVADVPLGTGETPYSRFGDWLGWLSLGGMGFFVVFIPVSLKRVKS